MDNNLAKYILTTVTYYDVMDFPMTGFEVWKYLTRVKESGSGNADEENKYSLAEVFRELEDEKLQKFIEEYRGYYFLRGRKGLVIQRMERNKLSEKKIRIAQKAAWWLRFVPFVRSVSIAGRLAMKNAEDRSDLDFFIILKKDRIFIGRFLVTLFLHILGKRRHGGKIRDRVCLNHFITSQFSVFGKDLFAAHEYSFMLPIFGGKAFKKFQAKNGWIRKYKMNFEACHRNLKMVPDSGPARLIRKSLERAFDSDILEKYLGQWQKNKIAKNPKTKQSGGIVLSSSEELAFWPNFENQGPKIFDKFQERLMDMEGLR